jgi:hypothetical protein
MVIVVKCKNKSMYGETKIISFGICHCAALPFFEIVPVEMRAESLGPGFAQNLSYIAVLMMWLNRAWKF